MVIVLQKWLQLEGSPWFTTSLGLNSVWVAFHPTVWERFDSNSLFVVKNTSKSGFWGDRPTSGRSPLGPLKVKVILVVKLVQFIFVVKLVKVENTLMEQHTEYIPLCSHSHLYQRSLLYSFLNAVFLKLFALRDQQILSFCLRGQQILSFCFRERQTITLPPSGPASIKLILENSLVI